MEMGKVKLFLDAIEEVKFVKVWITVNFSIPKNTVPNTTCSLNIGPSSFLSNVGAE